jgi:nitrite reductase/ring-hydroxylating ferredoxin subunit
MPWEKATALVELDRGPVLFRRSRRQIALFKSGTRLFAVNNRCPHEGYPLIQGTIDERCVLTCHWHNWKFQLEDGTCILGGDDVRSYPVEVRGEHVWVDTDDPAPAIVETRVLDGLRVAFDDRDFGRICREITRLHYNRLEPLRAVRKAVEWSHDRLEFGFTHAYAATSDWLALAATVVGDWERRLVCLAEAVDHMAFDALRHRAYPYAEPGDPFDAGAFAAAVEAEDTVRAEGLVRWGLADGLHIKQLEPAFVAAALAHYNDFGHSLIYVDKTTRLVEQLGQDVEPFILPALARHLCYPTREDQLPEFEGYAGALARLPSPAEDDHSPAVIHLPFPINTRDALAWTVEQLASRPPVTVYDTLLEILARSLLHFDTRYGFAVDRPVSGNVGWLDFTHGITFANAVRHVCSRYPELWSRGLLQMACFAGRNRRYLDESLDESPWMVEDREGFWRDVHEKLLDHGQREPIFSAHQLKTSRAVEDELAGASDSCQRYLLAGLNRFLASPIKQKHVRRLARQAIDLVRRDFDSEPS